ncbi:MAG: Adenylate cyclase [Segetibacter sp.]|nr:Adenylate cyclase [Segetibacter sp.]
MVAEILSIDELKKEKERLKALYQYNILDTEHEEAYDKIVDIASYICGTPISLITLIDSDRQWFKAKKGVEINGTSRDISFCNHAIHSDDLMEVQDLSRDERFTAHPLVTGEPGIRFYAGAPLKSPEGYKIGTLCVLDKEPRQLSDEQKQILETLAQQVVAQMELRKQHRQLQELNNGLIQELETKLEEQTKLLNLFTRFVPDEVVAKHLRGEGEEEVDDAEIKELTVLFCDIRGYMSVIENLPPRQVVQILQSYYSIMSDVISAYSGLVNQYVGDEIFATFGPPYSFPPYERNAVFCAMEMLEKLKDLNEVCMPYAQGKIKIGLGIHSGEAITGTLGSKNKIEFSITGDTVNTGKRIESLTQNQPNTILISEIVYDRVKEWVEVKPWEPIKVKGKSEPLQIFEVLGRRE